MAEQPKLRLVRDPESARGAEIRRRATKAALRNIIGACDAMPRDPFEFMVWRARNAELRDERDLFFRLTNGTLPLAVRAVQNQRARAAAAKRTAAARAEKRELENDMLAKRARDLKRLRKLSDRAIASHLRISRGRLRRILDTGGR